MSRGFIVAVAWLAGCGRIGFDASAGDGGIDAAIGGDGDTGAHARVFHGSEDFATGPILSAGLPATIDPARSFIVFSVSGSALQPDQGSVTARISSATSIEFTRIANGPVMHCVWHVVELPPGASVQRGRIIGGSIPVIAPVEPEHSFVIATWASNGVTFDEDDYLRSNLSADGHSLDLAIGGGGVPGLVDWQVVTWDELDVTRGTSTMTGTTASLGQSPIDVATTFALVTSFSPPDMSSFANNSISATIGAQLGVSRGAAGWDLSVSWQLIAVPNGRVITTSVNNGGSLSSDVTLSPPVALDRTFALSTTHGASSTFNGADAGVIWFTTELVGPDKLTVARGVPGSSPTLVVSAIELP